jgi:hypothetical protein
MAINSNRVGVRIESDRWGRRLERCLALEGQLGVGPGGRTKKASEKNFDTTTNLVGGKERQKKVISYGCSTCLVFGLMISHRNLVSFDSCVTNGARFPPETPRSQFGDRRCQGLGRVGKVKQDSDEYW